MNEQIGTWLADMIDARYQEGESLRAMERRAEKRGHSISHSYLAELRTRQVRKAPMGEQREAIAAALDAPIEAVVRAIIWDWFGWDILSVGGSDALVPPELTPAERVELDRLIKAWVATRRES